MKKFWESNYGGQGYDAVARRKGAALEPPATVAPVPTSRGAPAPAARAGGRTPLGGYRSGSSMSNEAVQQLQAQVADLSGQLEGLEKERDFYFEKVRSNGGLTRRYSRILCCYQLRDIEILVQEQLDSGTDSDPKDDEVFAKIQKILYSTEVGLDLAVNY